MKKIRVSIDMDGVLVSFLDALGDVVNRRKGNPFVPLATSDKFGHKYKSTLTWDVFSEWGISDDEFHDSALVVTCANPHKYSLLTETCRDALDTVEWHLITARPANRTYVVVDRLGLSPRSVHVGASSLDKHRISESLGCVAHFDDSPSVINAFWERSPLGIVARPTSYNTAECLRVQSAYSVAEFIGLVS